MPAFPTPMGSLGRVFAALTDGLFADVRLRRQMRKAPRADLASLDDNTFARITGTVRPFRKRLLEAPLSGRHCVYYSITVLAVLDGRRGHSTEIGSEQEAMTFVLEDETASAVINPAHARISVAFDFVSESKAAFDADERQRAVLERLSLVRRNWFTTDRLLYREAIIGCDRKLAILGAGVREPDPDAPPTGMYRDSGPQRLRFTGTAKYRLLISDDPKAL